MEDLEAKSGWRKAIIREGKRYEAQCTQDRVDIWPISYEKVSAVLCKYVTDNKSARSINNVISGLKHYVILQSQMWLDIKEDYLLKRLIKMLHYHDPALKKVRLAATMEVIMEVINHLRPDNPEERHFGLSILMAHNGLFRGGELFRPEGIKVHDVEWNDTAQEVGIVLKRSKTKRKGEEIKIILKDYKGMSAYKVLKQWYNKYQLWQHPNAYVLPFIMRKRKYNPTSMNFTRPASISRWRKDIKKYFTRAGLPGHLYSGHSFRAGGATDLFTENVPYPHIKKMGRWKSDAALVYFKAPNKVAVSVANAFQSNLKRIQLRKVGIQGSGERSRPYVS